MAAVQSKAVARQRRQRRVRKRLRGTTERPRLTVFRSNSHIYAQVIDDTSNRVLVSASSTSKAFQALGKRGGNIDGATLIGTIVAEKALAQGIQQVVFDRNGFLYHGRVAAVANAAREKGLKL
jgi:large subunit ribosomal protein L18